jgi:lysophospholipase L1-like esterase
MNSTVKSTLCRSVLFPIDASSKQRISYVAGHHGADSRHPMKANFQFGATAVAVCALLAFAVIVGIKYEALFKDRALRRFDPAGLEWYATDNRMLSSKPAPYAVFIGDSRIVQWNPRPMLGERTAIWRGIGGESSSQLDLRFNQDAIALKPSILVMQTGINELVASISIDRERDAVEHVFNRIKAMVTRANASGINVYLLSVIPPSRPGPLRRLQWSDAIYSMVDQLNTKLAAPMDGACFVDLGQALQTSGALRLPATFATDDLHLNAKGYERMNEALERAIREDCRAL